MFSKFNFGDNHVFDFYHTFVGKQEMKGKHQKNVQNVVNSMTLLKMTWVCMILRGISALLTWRLENLVFSNSIFLQFELSGSILDLLFKGLQNFNKKKYLTIFFLFCGQWSWIACHTLKSKANWLHSTEKFINFVCFICL